MSQKVYKLFRKNISKVENFITMRTSSKYYIKGMGICFSELLPKLNCDHHPFSNILLKQTQMKTKPLNFQLLKNSINSILQ